MAAPLKLTHPAAGVPQLEIQAEPDAQQQTQPSAPSDKMLDVLVQAATQSPGTLWKLGWTCSELAQKLLRPLRPGVMRNALLGNGYKDDVLPKVGDKLAKQVIQREFFAARFFEDLKAQAIDKGSVLETEIPCPYSEWALSHSAAIGAKRSDDRTVTRAGYMKFGQENPTWSEHTLPGFLWLEDLAPNGRWSLFGHLNDRVDPADDARLDLYDFSNPNCSKPVLTVPKRISNSRIYTPRFDFTRDQTRLIRFSINHAHRNLEICRIDLTAVPPASDTQNLRLPFNPHPWTIDLGFKFSPNGNWIFSRGYDSADRYIVMLMDLRKDGEAWLLEEKKALFSDILFSANEDAILLAEYTERSGILYDLTLPVAERKATNIDSLSFLYEMQIDGVNGYRSLSADAPGWFYSPNNYRMARTKWVNRIDGVGLKPANSGNIAVTYK